MPQRFSHLVPCPANHLCPRLPDIFPVPESEILQGIPLYTQPQDFLLFNFSSSVYIPGEVSDPQAIYWIGNLNKFLINVQYDFYHGIIQGGYIHRLQQEVNETDPDLLATLLRAMVNREFYCWFHWWCAYPRSQQGPLSLYRDLEIWQSYFTQFVDGGFFLF